MSWFRRRRPEPDALGPLQNGLHRSPGLARLCSELGRRRPESILDLGASSTENVSFLSRYTANLCIQDLFHGACVEPGRRSSTFRFGSVESLELPAAGERFDVVLMWDLIHYFELDDRRDFVARIGGYCRPEALVLLAASSVAAIPLEPIQFKIESEESIHYTVPAGERTGPAGFNTRQIEGLMQGFEPVRFFQLRNGLQEFLFRYTGDEEPDPNQMTLAEIARPGPDDPVPAPGDTPSDRPRVSGDPDQTPDRPRPPSSSRRDGSG